MTKMIETKDRLIRFCGQYETYLLPVVRFVAAFILFSLINANIGYMKTISTPFVAFVLAVVCGLLPTNFTLLFAAVVVLLDMYALSVEVLAVTLVLFLLVYILYFRFAPGEGMAAVLTPVAFKLGIPYLMPVGIGLLRQPQGILSVVFTTVLYYYLDGVKNNETAFVATAEEDLEVSSKFAMAIGQIAENQEMFLVLAVFLAVSLVVYLIRRSKMDYSWTVAIVAGGLIQIISLLAGGVFMNVSDHTVSILVGGCVSMLAAFVIQFFCMNLDYGRTERVQFEDDEYYYYVKAVPKKLLASEEKVVKHFGNTGNLGRRIERTEHVETPEEKELSGRVIARELDIDEKLL